MRIIVDAMGGDHAPESAVWGGALAAKEFDEEVVLVGRPEPIAEILKAKGMAEQPGLHIVPASDLVDMHDDPATVLRRKPDSSMAVAFKLLKSGEGDALVSAGNTGALLTGATLFGGHPPRCARPGDALCRRSGHAVRRGCEHRVHGGDAAAICVFGFAVCGKDQRGA